MPKGDVSTEDTQKTALLLGVGNLILSPLYYVNAKLGITASLALTAAAIYELHELGKSRRPAGNAVNKANNFFSSITGAESSDIDNAVKNIVNGGAAVYDQITPK